MGAMNMVAGGGTVVDGSVVGGSTLDGSAIGGGENVGINGFGVGSGKNKSCCCHQKETPRSEEFQASLQKRLNRAIGQLNAVKRMIDDNRYCGDVLVQLAAAESAVHSVSMLMLQDHMETCVVERIQRGDSEVVEETVQLIKRFAK